MIRRRQTAKGPRYDVRLRDAEGTVYNRTFTTKREAEEYERAELTARDRGESIDRTARRRTFADVSAEWLASNPGKRAATVARDRAALEHLAELGPKRIGSITPKDVQAVVATMTASLAPSTVHRNYRVAAAVFRYASDRDYIGKSPCRTVKLPAVARPSIHVFTPDELGVLAGSMPVEHSPMIWLGAVLGLRWGEAAAVHVRDVDLLGRELRVRHTVTRDATGASVIGRPKSEAGRRTLALPGPLADLLGAHFAATGLTVADADRLVFPAAEGGVLVASNWRLRVWIPAAIAAGVGRWVVDEDGTKHYDGATFHDLRRTSATELVVAGVDVRTAQTRLGHSAARLTLELYAQAVPAAERAASDLVGERLMIAPRDGRAMRAEGGAAG